MENKFTATGRRKNAIARVIVKPGSGKREVNGNPFKDYLKSDLTIMDVEQPLELLQLSSSYDIYASVMGGGLSGQAGAIRLGIARALVSMNEEYRKILRKHGLLTRDSRMVERKKYGMSGARKRYQFSKR